MSKPSQRKRQRRDKRKKTELARRQRFSNKKAAAQQFPDFKLDVDDAPAPLAAALRQAVKRIRFENEQLFAGDLLDAYRRARTFGFAFVVAEVASAIRNSRRVPLAQDDLLKLKQHLDDTVGETLYSLLPPTIRENYLTFNFMIVVCGLPFDDTILLRVRSLCQQKTPHGTTYYSPHRPTVQTDCGPKVVAFSGHALQRIRERTVLAWDTCEGNCDSVGFMITCDYFEPCYLPGSDYGFTFFNECHTPGSVFHKYAEATLDSLDDDKDYYYRVGYCPAVMAGDYLVAKTLLLPGMETTPEYDRVLRRQARSYDEKLAIRKRVKGLTLKNLATTLDFSLIKQFHEAGIPQVVSFAHPIFRFDAISEGRYSN